jgi:urease beta subunit
VSKFNATRVEHVAEGGQQHYHFEQHKVKVKIHRQNDEKEVVVRGETEVPPLAQSQSHFTVIRHVMNLDLTKSGGEKIDPPASIQVELEPADISSGHVLADIRLAYWDDASDKWIVFTHEKHHFRHIAGSSKDQSHSVEAEIAKWGDPPIAVGHIPTIR